MEYLESHFQGRVKKKNVRKATRGNFMQIFSFLKVTLQIFHNFLSSVDVTKLSDLYASCKHIHTHIPVPFISKETIWLFVNYLWITDALSNIVCDTLILINFLQLNIKGADIKI